MAQNPTVIQTSLPQTIPPQTVPMVTMDGSGNMIVNQTWYLFLYNVARQVLPVSGGSPLITGGGGAVTIADGADVAEGATTDNVWTGGAGTEVSLLKALVPQYTTEYDYDVNNNAIYYGIAATGSAVSAGAWQIRQLTYSVTGNLLSMLYANGSRAFNNAWTARGGLSYS